MRGRESLRIAWRAITGHKLRSTLTTLGVVIGVASVIAFMVLGSGFQASVLGDIQSENEPEIFVQTTQPTGSGFDQPLQSPVYTETDVEALRDVDGVTYVAPEGSVATSQVLYDGEPTSLRSVTATTPERFEHDGVLNLTEGEPFSGPGEAVVVRGQLAGLEANVSVGDELVLVSQNRPDETVVVTGIVENQLGGQPESPSVYVSADAYYETEVETPRGTRELAYESLQIRADSVEDVDRVKAEAGDYLHNESDASGLIGGNAEIQVQTLSDAIEQFTSILDQITVFIAGIAGISLVVGSIGIANIMIVSVTERTREIGIMKAVGARERDVVQLFLVESVILGAIGAVGGVLLGIGAGHALTSLLDWPMAYPWDWVAIAVAVGIVVGVLAGSYPAWRAARVDPIEALRRE